MNQTMNDYLENADRFHDVITADPDADWTAPSPCAGWSAAAVLDHVVQTQRDFLLSREAPLGDPAVGTPPEVWADHVAAVAALGTDDAFVTRTYDGYFGPTTVGDTLRDFYGFDLIVHRWDLGRALGHEVDWSEAEMDHVETSIEGFGPTMYSEGICADAVPVPDDASRQLRILGLLGRVA